MNVWCLSGLFVGKRNGGGGSGSEAREARRVEARRGEAGSGGKCEGVNYFENREKDKQSKRNE